MGPSRNGPFPRSRLRFPTENPKEIEQGMLDGRESLCNNVHQVSQLDFTLGLDFKSDPLVDGVQREAESKLFVCGPLCKRHGSQNELNMPLPRPGNTAQGNQVF